MTLNRAIGLVAVTLGSHRSARGVRRAPTSSASITSTRRSAELDALDAEALAALPVPIADRISAFEPRADCTTMPLYERRGEDRFDEAVAMFRGVPGARLEPGPRERRRQCREGRGDPRGGAGAAPHPRHRPRRDVG